MKHTIESIEQKEMEFYNIFLDKAQEFVSGGKVTGIEMRQIIAAGSVVAKMVQTRGAMKALEFQIKRDSSRLLK